MESPLAHGLKVLTALDWPSSPSREIGHSSSKQVDWKDILEGLPGKGKASWRLLLCATCVWQGLSHCRFQIAVRDLCGKHPWKLA